MQIESSLPHINFSYVWLAWLCHTFDYHFRNGKSFGNNVFCMKCVVYSWIYISENFLRLWRYKLDITTNILLSSRKVPEFFDFNQVVYFYTYFKLRICNVQKDGWEKAPIDMKLTADIRKCLKNMNRRHYIEWV